MMGEKKEISRLMTFFFFHSSLRFVSKKKTVNLPWSLGSLGGDCLATESEGPPPARWFRSIIRLPPIIFALGRQLKWWEPGQCFGFWIISSVLLCQGLYSVTLWLFIRADTLTHSHAIRRTHTHTRKTKIFSIWAFSLVVKLLWTHQMFKVQQNQLKLAHRLYALCYYITYRPELFNLKSTRRRFWPLVVLRRNGLCVGCSDLSGSRWQNARFLPKVSTRLQVEAACQEI